jgi:hypothetical protein
LFWFFCFSGLCIEVVSGGLGSVDGFGRGGGGGGGGGSGGRIGRYAKHA